MNAREIVVVALLGAGIGAVSSWAYLSSEARAETKLHKSEISMLHQMWSDDVSVRSKQAEDLDRAMTNAMKRAIELQERLDAQNRSLIEWVDYQLTINYNDTEHNSCGRELQLKAGMLVWGVVQTAKIDEEVRQVGWEMPELYRMLSRP
jgi:hypothetical protein